MKIMSFNTQHCESYLAKKIDIGLFAHYLKGIDADVIGLNEMRGEGPLDGYTDQLGALAKELGFHSYFAQSILVKGENPYGNGLLSRYPIISAKTVIIQSPDDPDKTMHYEQRSILIAVLDTPCGELTVLITHFGLSPEEQQNAVIKVTENLKDEKCILMGDFNVTPSDPILSPICKRLFDTAEVFESPLLSFPSDAPKIKIDYIFTSKDIKIKKADIPPHVISDHRPYIIEISEEKL